MNILTYLSEIEHAVNVTFEALWADHRELETLSEQLKKLTAEMEEGYRRAAAFQDCEDSDDAMLGTGIYWDTYFGADKEWHHANTSLQDMPAKLQVREFSRASLAGSILQYAKQGISIVHGNLQSCPLGRHIGTQELKNVIWQSRNQALHWEAGNFHKPVKDCFDLLDSEIDTKFGAFTNKCMAFEIVELLGWKSFHEFKGDMLSMT